MVTDNKQQKEDYNKLARKLKPNQSIRSEQKKSNLGGQPLISHHPHHLSHEFFKSNLVIDCSQKIESENEAILNELLQMIDYCSPEKMNKSKKRKMRRGTTIDRPRNRSNSESDPLLALDFVDFEMIIDQEKMIRLLKKNHQFFSNLKNNQKNLHFVLGLNSILNYLQNLTFIFLQISELVKLSNSRFLLESSSNQNINHDPDDQSAILINQTKSKGKKVNGMIDGDKFEELLRSVKVVRYIVVFNNHFNNQHHSIISVISPLINSINQALSFISSSNHVSNPQTVLSAKSIELVGFPVDFIQPILKKFDIKRLSCFAILDSTPGLEKLIDKFKN